MAFHPYLFFSGNCREAFTRYQEIFGGELFLMSMADIPADTGPPPKRRRSDHARRVEVRRRPADGL